MVVRADEVESHESDHDRHDRARDRDDEVPVPEFLTEGLVDGVVCGAVHFGDFGLTCVVFLVFEVTGYAQHHREETHDEKCQTDENVNVGDVLEHVIT